MAHEFTIEKGVPLPSQDTGHNLSPLTAIIREMEIGDSIFVPRPITAAHIYGRTRKLYPAIFTCRQCVGGFRVWRTS